MKRLIFTLLIFACHTLLLQAQGTFDQVYNIIQTNCALPYCHNVSASGSLNLSGAKQDVYAALVGVNPDNVNALANGYKRVDPGYPRNSFLLKKINNGLDPYNDRATNEGDAMPQTGGPLSSIEIELVRQWIMFGAPDTGMVVDSQLVADYYNGGGLAPIAAPAPPTADGFQVLMGPFFMPPHTEIEYSKKQALFNTNAIEVVQLQAAMNDESHHFAMFKYLPNRDTLMDVGLRRVDGIADAAGVFYNSTIIAEWANSMELNLPEGTAFFWENNAVLDLNYHIINPSDSILAALVYLNVGTQASGIAESEMKAAPIYYGGNNVAALVIPNSGDTTFTMLQFDTDSTYNWNLWMIMAHTHERGKTFDVWLRNQNGSKGDQIYNGNYNEDYTTLQGYFDWEHPPVKFFNPLQTVNMANGLIHEATFTNNGLDTIYFGLTTQDEMFVTYLLYTDDLSSGINAIGTKENGLVKVYPHPFSGSTRFDVATTSSAPLSLTVFDLLGREVDIMQGIENLSFQYKNNDLLPGIYIFSISQNNVILSTGKLVVK